MVPFVYAGPSVEDDLQCMLEPRKRPPVSRTVIIHRRSRLNVKASLRTAPNIGAEVLFSCMVPRDQLGATTARLQTTTAPSGLSLGAELMHECCSPHTSSNFGDVAAGAYQTALRPITDFWVALSNLLVVKDGSSPQHSCHHLYFNEELQSWLESLPFTCVC